MESDNMQLLEHQSTFINKILKVKLVTAKTYFQGSKVSFL